MSIREKIDSNFLYLFDQGKCTNAYEFFGSHLIKKEGKMVGVEFLLYAPNAKYVDVLGEWNDFKPGNVMERITNNGVFYLKLDGNFEWQRYKYLITTFNDEKIYKADPYAFYSQVRPSQDSKVYDIDGYKWGDDVWMYTHPKTYDKPLAIYEMHIGSWKRKPDGSFNMFNEVADMLVPYLKDFGFTHVEVMPVYEHPLDMSWGYQGTGYYAVTPRYGVPKDFMNFVDKLHQAGIGVIMDWVPGHICKDGHGLYKFDGTYLYEYPNEQDRENKEWGTANLDLGKGVTRSYLYSNALFFMNYFHIDGFRLDAVSNMIYWLGNKNRGVNEGACDFLRGLSNNLFSKDDRVLLMAEDSSDFGNVTKPTWMGGLGFNYKWDMGWMNDTLKYFKEDPIYRKYDHNKLSFSMMYNYNEEFCLPLSHDEVVHMKGSLVNKMPGDMWQQFANYRTLLGYQFTHPGKKLLFMGQEFAPYDEWHYEKELPWEVLKYPFHDAAWRYVKELTTFYKNEPALWEKDFDPTGFEWIEANNEDHSMYVYARFAKDYHDHVIVIMNNTPNTYTEYQIGCKECLEYKEVLNSDWNIYNGSGRCNPLPLKVRGIHADNQEHSILVTIPPLSIIILKAVYDEKKDKELKLLEKKSKKTKKNGVKEKNE